MGPPARVSPGSRRAVIDSYAELGFTRCVIGVPQAGEDDALRALDGAADLVADFALD